MKTQFISLLVAVLLGFLPVHAQQMSITGTVKDKKLNDPVIGASIVIKGTTNGSITDLDGNFQLDNVSPGSTLVISYIGFQTEEILVQEGKTNYQVGLSEDNRTLDEVVVVGFGTQKKVNLTGAVATVDTKALESRPVSQVGQALQGTVPGLNLSASDLGGQLGQSMKVNIRGTGTIGTGSKGEPLILIDGMEGNMNNLNPDDIEYLRTERCGLFFHLRFTGCLRSNPDYYQKRKSRKDDGQLQQQFPLLRSDESSQTAGLVPLCQLFQ